MGLMPKKATDSRLKREVMWLTTSEATELGFAKPIEVHIMAQHSPGARHGTTEFSVSLMSFGSILA